LGFFFDKNQKVIQPIFEKRVTLVLECSFVKTDTLALMVAVSFCAGVRYKKYSGQQEIAPKN